MEQRNIPISLVVLALADSPINELECISMDSFPHKVLIAGTIRNGSSTVANSIHDLSRAFEGMAEVMWLVIESDSTDNTVSILEEISREKKNFKYITLGNLSSKHPKRTDRIAHARNVYLMDFQQLEEYSECTHLVVADLDGVNNLISRSGVESSFALNPLGVFTANQSGPYYDIWALRHDFWSPNDCWAELEFYRNWYQWPEYALQKSVLSRMIRIPEDADLIEVQSAFGGLAIYPRDAVGNTLYVGLDDDGKEICEHIRFSEGIRRNGYKIFINPKMINTKYTEFSLQKKLKNKLFRLARYPVKKFNTIFRK